jgi:hypothetical protein
MGKVGAVTDEGGKSPGEPDDPWAAVHHELSQDLMRAFMGMPSVLQAAFEGESGAVEVTSEEYAQAMVTVQQIVLKHLPNIAGTAAVAYGTAKALQTRVEALERRVDELS